MTVFVDTFAFIAWLSPKDPAHIKVSGYLEAFTGRMVTTEWVLMELADALAAPKARSTAAAFIHSIRNDALFEVLGYLPELHEAGFQLYVDRPDKAWSLTDCISFEAMKLRGLSEALTADQHFEQAGFRAVFK